MAHISVEVYSVLFYSILQEGRGAEYAIVVRFRVFTEI